MTRTEKTRGRRWARWAGSSRWPADPLIEMTMRQELAAIADRREWDSTAPAIEDRQPTLRRPAADRAA